MVDTHQNVSCLHILEILFFFWDLFQHFSMTADLCREGAGGQILIFTEDIRVEECVEDEAESS